MSHSIIRVLSAEQAQQIAAGEVIERPANIVKELLENSIDAKAKSITIHIEQAGKKRISISDDGCGMTREDALLCFARHATSKLHSVDDLMNLSTFGFRGEALASIASVSVVTLTTTPDSEANNIGTCVRYAQGKQISIDTTAHPVGTTLEITDLFATIPVRKSFLKNDETEWNQIAYVIQSSALVHQNVSFKVYKDGVIFLHAPAVETLSNRIAQIWGHNIAEQLTPVVLYKNAPFSLAGSISTPPFARYGKQLILIFINGRIVKNSELVRAIVKGYKQSLPPGKYPAAFLFLSIDKQQVDVNIHPRKEEVRFTRPGIVSRVIEETIIHTLEQSISSRLGKSESSSPAAYSFATPMTEQPIQNSQPLVTSPLPLPFAPEVLSAHTPAPTQPIAALQPTSLPEVQAPIIAPTATTFCVIGQIFETYILISADNELIIIDQHAAHERILYHQFSTTFSGKEGTQLLFPLTCTLSNHLIEKLLNHTDFFSDQGIQFHHAGPHQLAITTTPPQLQQESLTAFLQECATFIEHHETLDQERFFKQLNEHVHSHMACKAAVRAGDVLDAQRMKHLVEQLMETPNRFMCVHGRPTMWRISRTEFEKQFKRK